MLKSQGIAYICCPVNCVVFFPCFVPFPPTSSLDCLDPSGKCLPGTGPPSVHLFCAVFSVFSVPFGTVLGQCQPPPVAALRHVTNVQWSVSMANAGLCEVRKACKLVSNFFVGTCDKLFVVLVCNESVLLWACLVSDEGDPVVWCIVCV